ncbi:hypothetical protein K6Y31_04245 [Motilimonas cestriensis]|uniref:Tox-PAAR-like domain-containing protein n=1 Tax=Motilimonas cestriensis TaxID=2742685 RepID=A0ABS8W685_9GAMM|nr:hypothetical protein [Motilimonas cestriensis]MCE2594025.1 hypothetical protein [Motilimonas cestriensis]
MMAKSYFRSSGASASVGGYSAPSLSGTGKPQDIAALNTPPSGSFMKTKVGLTHSIVGINNGSVVKRHKPQFDIEPAPAGSFLKPYKKYCKEPESI